MPYVGCYRRPVPHPILRRGACPGVVDAMVAADGMLMRVRLPGGAVDGAGLRALGRVAAGYGNGIVEITSRANLQVRGVAAGDLEAATEVLVDAGLSTGDADLDARRAIVAPALAGHDPAAAVDLTPHLASVGEHLLVANVEGELPAKFSVVLDDGSALGVGDVDGDVVAVVGAGDSVDAVTARVLGQVALLAAGGQPAVRPASPVAGPTPGVHPHHAPGRANIVAAPALGRLDVGQLDVLARLAAGTGLRFTHRRGVALPALDRAGLADLLGALAGVGLSTDPADPVHGVSACAGRPGCASALADTQAAALALIVARRTGPGPHAPVHLAGCDKRCGAPATGDLLVAGADGRFEGVR